MAYNVPDFTTSDISFGPAVVYIGNYAVAGVTPSTDIGAIGEDGVTFEITSEKKYISQGNPATPAYAFTQTNGAKISFTSLEWDFQHFADSLGAGVTATDGPATTSTSFKWGGSPSVRAMTIRVQHLMNNGNTMDIKVWKCFSDAGFSIAFGQDEHQFEMSWTAAVPEAAAKTWDDRVLDRASNLIEFERITAA